MPIEAYCVKCKKKQAMKDPTKGQTRNGKPMTTGLCPACGTRMCRIGSIERMIPRA